MTVEAQRITIAQACGWTDIDIQGQYCFGTQPARSELDARQFMLELPHYLNDLNAMHEAEKRLTEPERRKYTDYICGITGGLMDSWFSCAHATAAQRAEALLRTLNLWRDEV